MISDRAGRRAGNDEVALAAEAFGASRPTASVCGATRCGGATRPPLGMKLNKSNK
jgi:hypothetical protein